jgi:CBS domain-containing protein
MDDTEVSEMVVSRFCSSDLIAAEVTDTLIEAAQQMARNHVGALAVFDEGSLVGIISEADIVTAIAEEASLFAASVEEYMTEEPITIAPGDDAGLAARRMVEHGISHLPVVDAGSAIAMVSKGDLLAIGAIAYHELR